MSPRQEDILNLIRTGPISIHGLADRVYAPGPSIRRDIQALRRLGHNINDARDNNGLYRLVPASV